MSKIEFLYDFGSPNAYLVHKVLPKIAAQHDVEIDWQPVLLGGIFKATNNQAPMTAFADVLGKNEYMQVEFRRFIERYGVPFSWNSHFPVNTLAIMRGAAFATGKSWQAHYVDTVFDAMWLKGQDMSDVDIISGVLQAAGLPYSDIISAVQSPEVKGKLVDATSSAVGRGVFGAPTMFFKNEMFFGKDSIGDLNWRLG